MEEFKNEELEEDFFLSHRQKEKKKEKILDQDFEKAKEIKQNPVRKKEDKYTKKKPFLKLGIILLIFTIICFIILDALPWMYIKFDASNDGTSQVEYYYDKNFVITNNEEQNETINNFFESINSNIYMGINPTDFSSLYYHGKYIFYSMIAIGIVFTIFAIFDKKRNLSIETSTIIHTLFAGIVAGLCIYFIFLSVKFLASVILIVLNYRFINPILPNLVIVYLAPMIVLFIMTGVLKVTFSVIKSNFKIFEKIKEGKKPKKSFYNYGYRGKTR